MLGLKQRKAAFVQLGKALNEFSQVKEWSGYESGISQSEFDEMNQLIKRLKSFNGWFTEDNVRRSFKGISQMLEEQKIEKWLNNYTFNDQPKTFKVGVIMAGNIPMVGFHDMLCVLLSGNCFVGKLSSDDDKLLPKVAELLCTIEPEFKEMIRFESERLTDFDAVIATGSNNSARYFEYYFGKYPHVIRKNRNSIAVLTGNESEEELKLLGEDLFSYFGLGCRSISKIFLPEGYDLNNLFNAIYNYHQIIDHNKYASNYDYHKAVMLMNREDVLENGFLLVKRDKGLASPVATLYYDFYKNDEMLQEELKERKGEIQCVVSKKHIPFGKAQQPEVWDYADGVDTIDFLLNL